MAIEKDSVTLTSDGSGTTIVGYTRAMNGKIVSVQYVKSNYTDGVDFAITNETTGQGIWTANNVNAAATVYPLQLATDNAGANLTAIYKPIVLADERVAFSIASPGNSHSGTFIVTVDR